MYSGNPVRRKVAKELSSRRVPVGPKRKVLSGTSVILSGQIRMAGRQKRTSKAKPLCPEFTKQFQLLRFLLYQCYSPNNMDPSKESGWLLSEKYAGVKTPEFFADLKRLEAGEPLAFIIGWVDFLGCRIDLSARPLIPRPETEFWVEQTIAQLKTNYHTFVDRLKYGSSKKGVRTTQATHPQKRILDLFAGSGCIGVALLKHLSDVVVDFGEKDSMLCKQTKKNIAFNKINQKRTRVIQTNVLSNITDAYDYIFANPPYVDPLKKDTVQDSVLGHEPHDALFADDGGLYFIKQLLADGAAHIKKEGAIYIEFGEGQKETIAGLAKNTSWKSEFLKDQFGKWRLVKLTHS